MLTANGEAADFESDPDQLSELGKLSEALIHKELDAELMHEFVYDYLEILVERPDSLIPSDIGEEEQQAVVEIADLILRRIDAKDQ